MRRIATALVLLVLICILAFTLNARSRKRNRHATGTPGQFDYYLLSLSWSPEYCAGPGGSRDPGQCGSSRRFGFVVHGLWPQYEQGYPQSCAAATTVPASIVKAMLPLMPSPTLIQHEWATHGTCSGLGVTKYFQEIQSAFAKVKIPDAYRGPLQQVIVAPEAIRQNFVTANQGFPAGAFRLACSGRYLSEVRVCLTKDLAARACSADVKDTCSDPDVILRPLR